MHVFPYFVDDTSKYAKKVWGFNILDKNQIEIKSKSPKEISYY